MPPIAIWWLGSLAFTAIAGGSIWAVAQPDEVTNINLPDDMTQEELDSVFSEQPKTLGDGLSAVGGAAALASVVYLITKKG